MISDTGVNIPWNNPGWSNPPARLIRPEEAHVITTQLITLLILEISLKSCLCMQFFSSGVGMSYIGMVEMMLHLPYPLPLLFMFTHLTLFFVIYIFQFQLVKCLQNDSRVQGENINDI